MRSKAPGILAICVLSFLLSMSALGTIAYKWIKARHDPYHSATTVISNNLQLDQYLGEAIALKDSEEFKHGDTCRIPTGFFIQSLAFSTPSDVNVTGYLWQKYDPKQKCIGDITDRKLIFPEEVDSSSTEWRKVYELKPDENGGKYHLIGWYFDVTLRQSFDYTDYPLDFLTVWLRLWQEASFTNNSIMLVPDFDSYLDINDGPFGLDVDIVHGEWEIDNTFFSYKKVPYDTDFGFSSKNQKTLYYRELYINLVLRREFMNAFIINLVPLLVVAILLYSQVMTVSGSRDQAEKFGFDTSGVITNCSALFFVVLLAHIQIRRMFAGSGLVYLEYFYLIMYFIILLTAVNAYIFSLEGSEFLKLVHYRNNFLAKVAYWPVVLWMMAIVTLIKL